MTLQPPADWPQLVKGQAAAEAGVIVRPPKLMTHICMGRSLAGIAPAAMVAARAAGTVILAAVRAGSGRRSMPWVGVEVRGRSPLASPRVGLQHLQSPPVGCGTGRPDSGRSAYSRHRGRHWTVPLAFSLIVTTRRRTSDRSRPRWANTRRSTTSATSPPFRSPTRRSTRSSAPRCSSVPYPVAAIQEMARILKPGGRLLVTAPLASYLHQEPFHYYDGYTQLVQAATAGTRTGDRVHGRQ